MYHVGRPGEDGFTERMMAAWGCDAHNSHTNVCSSGARSGYQYWTGIDRPSPDHARAKVIFLVSAISRPVTTSTPTPSGSWRPSSGARSSSFSTRGSPTPRRMPTSGWHRSRAPRPPSTWPSPTTSSRHDLYNRDYVRRWWNWQEYLDKEHPGLEPTFESFERVLKAEYETYTFEFAAQESGIEAEVLRQVAEIVSTAGTRLSTHNWRSGRSNEGGWQVSRTLFMLNALMGAVATPGGLYPNAWNKFVPGPFTCLAIPSTGTS